MTAGSQDMVAHAIGRVPALVAMDASEAFAERRRRLPEELDGLTAVLLELDVDDQLRESVVEGYLVRRLEEAYAVGSSQTERAHVAGRSLMREFTL